MESTSKPLTRGQQVGSWLALVFVVFVGILFCVLRNLPGLNSTSLDEIATLRTQLGNLTTKQLAAKMANINADTTTLDKQIQELRIS